MVLRGILLASVALTALPSAAWGQTAAAPVVTTEADTTAADAGLADIVVTAQRRSENLQRAAIAVSAVSGDALRDAGVTKPTELTSVVPSLQVAPAAGPYNLFYLRGVGNFSGNSLSDSAIAFNIDGVYVGRPSSTTGFFYDLDRVEIVKGPQGTLYGRNATGGAINVITHKPELDELGGSVSGEYGNYNAVRVDGEINVPLGDKAAIRAAGIYVRHDGYMNDGTDDQKDYGGRVQLRVDPTETLKIIVEADYFHQGGKGTGATPVALGVDNRIGILSPQGQAYYMAQPNTLNGRTFRGIDISPYLNDNFWGTSATIDWSVPFGTITIIPAHREGNVDYLDATAGFVIRQIEHDRQTSVEARAASNDDHPFRWLAGAFAYDETDNTPLVVYNHQSNASYQTNIRTDTKSLAVFGRLTYAITPDIRLSAGGRFTTEDKQFAGSLTAASRICVRPTTFFPTYVPGCPNAAALPYGVYTPPALNFVPGPDGTITTASSIDNTGANARRASFERVTYRVAADWDITPRNLLYASFETGFKSGGFFFATTGGTFKPERIDAFTLGSKNRFLDNRLQLNVEAFYWRYKDQQISHSGIDSAGIAIFPTENVGRATFKGVEVETRLLPLPNTMLSADVQYLDARYDNFVYQQANFNGGAGNGTACPTIGTPGQFYTVDCSGNRPPNAPELTLNLGAQQTIPLGNDGKLVGGLRGHHQSVTLTGLEFLASERQAGYWTADASLTYAAPKDRFSLTLFVNNAFDKTIISSAFPPPFSLFTVATLRPPRTFGIRGSVKF